jgi:ABC-2 type transport system permease protein
MSSRAIKPRRDGGGGPNWQAIEERAPSAMRDDGPLVARYVAVFGLMMLTLGGAALVFKALNRPYLIAPGWGIFFVLVGVMALAFHAFKETDFQFRRLYGALGGILFVAALFFRVFPVDKTMGDGFLKYGAVSLVGALIFLLTFLRNEGESNLRSKTLALLGLTALASALTGLIGGMLSEAFLLDTGIIHLVFGLLFAFAYIAIHGADSDRGFWAGRLVGLFGAIMLVVALWRSIMPWVLFNMGWMAERPPRAFFLPSGLIFIYIGLEYVIAYLLVCSDSKLVVLTRRELAAFYCSPIAYVLMIAMAILGWWQYWMFLLTLTDPRGGGTIQEPIFTPIFVSFLAIIPVIVLVPVITMRLVSEEKRTGTLEVLLTAPVEEWQVVLAKFFAGLRVFMVCWYLWGIYFIALRVDGGKEFDYRPLITFYVALLCMGAGFIAMGVFFSTITRHQIAAAIFSFIMMLVFLILFFVGRTVMGMEWLSTVISYVSYIDLWIAACEGKFVPRFLVFNLSVAVIWIFVSMKVLEARKWT